MGNNLTLETFIQTVKLNHGNIYSFEKVTYVDASTPVIITCIKHNYDFTVSAAALLRKTLRNGGQKKDPIVGSCPKCREEYFAEIKRQIFQKFKKTHNNEYDYDEDSYVNASMPFTIICRIHGKFQVLGHTHGDGNGKCLKCHPIKYNPNPREKYDGDNRYYICDIHGDVIIGKNRSMTEGCPTCNNERAFQQAKEARNRAIIRKYESANNVSFNADNSVTLICKKCGTAIILKGKNCNGKSHTKKYQCNLCNQDIIDATKQDAILKIKKIINGEYNVQYEYLDFIDNGKQLNSCQVKLFNRLTDKEKIVTVEAILRKLLSKNHRVVLRNIMSYDDAKVKVRGLGITNFREYKKWFIRTQPSELPTNPQRHYKEWISYCDFFGTNPKANMSWGEKRIDEYLQRKNIEYVWQKKFNDCRDKNPLPFDFYLPQYNLIIEFDGEQHHKSVHKFGGNDNLGKTQKHDKIKNQYCRDNNINIFRLTYDDLNNNAIEWSLDLELNKIAVKIF